MKTIYIDSDFKCHITNDGTMTETQHEFFNDKCDAFIEGYCYEPDNMKFYPWKSYPELSAAQAQYELDMAEAAAAYQEGVNSVYDQ